ncbi:D-alanyl-D-alanine carboxypeptidase [Streptomyces umbrinus]|uniref:D-alanyl-D-alanine carboxypeptidase n=1 Tax=Streptomyces umbrinus TaxID=67370 RepID=A0ABU0SI04_9ACTN|nr:serine hydrolase domain-containing protein [Streptomyces umbrinus]MDQ1022882.1 D-alanyl-D-alanine carboxypeptidase [Streptomyces umbrinus]
MKPKLTSHVVATTLVAGLACVGMTLPAAGATGSVTAPLHDTANSKALQAHADAVLKTGTVGVVARSTGPRGSRYATAGVADRATGNAVRPGDRFRIASTTKTFVAAVVLQLVGEGRLSLDDTVEHWLPGVVSGNGNDGSAITVRQLLQHTSGLFDYTVDFPEFASTAGYQADRYTTWTPERLVAIAMRHTPGFAPGDGWSYSNTNYILAGMIIQKATGHTWDQEATARHPPAGPARHRRPDDVPADGRTPSARLFLLRRGQGTDRRHRDQPHRGRHGGRHDQYDGRPHPLLPGAPRRAAAASAELAAMKTTVRALELDPGWPGVRYGLGLMEIPLSCGGAYYSHGGDMPGYTTRNGVSEDGRRTVVLNATSDGSTDSSTQQAANNLIDDELCA